jgi:TM2 domain-containing membrane protein YozV
MTRKRQLAAIMFTDITGFSAMMESDERYATMIRNRHRKVFKEYHKVHEGKILQYFGDGTLSIFDSATAAVECAVDMQIEFRKEPEVPLRIGIHTGDISYDDEGAYGDGLNIAARIERLCIPGGVFITAKVYDDIKNHPWLTAFSMGDFSLHNIHREVEIFAVTSKGLYYPSDQVIKSYPEYAGNTKDPRFVTRKRKGVAVVIAFFFGFFGIHRLYLGQHVWGIMHLIIAILSIVITSSMDRGFPPAALVGIWWMVDFVLLLAMGRAEFDYKFNRGVTPQPYKRMKRKNVVLDKTEGEDKNPALINGIRLYRQDRFHEAIAEFNRSLELDEKSAAAHFNLACCYSILRDADDSYYHLAKAVEMGFSDFERVRNHEALSFLRAQDDFQAFVENDYQVVSRLTSPKEDILSDVPRFNPEIIEKIENLGELLERGALTREEFDTHKKRILGND